MSEQRQHSGDAGDKLQRQILLPLTVIFFLSIAAFSTFVYHNERAHLSRSFKHELTAMQASYQEKIAMHGNNLRTALTFLERDQGLHSLLVAGDRAQMQARFSPLFEKLKLQFSITHFYFLDANRVTLLRLHQPTRWGDRIERFTAREAERTGHIAIGTELGPLGTITLRAVMPLREHGRIIGYIELGIEALDFMQDIGREFGDEITVYLRKESLSRQGWEQGMRILGRKPEWDRYPDFIVASQAGQDIPADIFHQFAESNRLNAISEYELKQNGQSYRLGFIPLRDVSGRHVGDFSVLHNTSATTTRTFRLLLTLVSVTTGCGIILIFMILGRMQRVLARNLAEIKHDEEDLRQSEIKLHSLYDSTSDAIMLLDEKGFFDCNKAALAMFGCATKVEFCTKHPGDLSPPEQPCGTDSLMLANQRIATAIDNGRNFFEWLHKRTDTGEVFYADVLLNRMVLDGKAVLQATVRDISERKHMEMALHELNETLEKRIEEQTQQNIEKERLLIQQSRNAAMGEMISNIAHQWRQPLSTLGLVVQNIHLDYKENQLTQKELEKYVETAQKCVVSMSETIDDFRDFFRPDKCKVHFNLHQTVSDSIALLEATMKNNGIQITLSADQGLQVFGHVNEFSQVILNLLANAKDALVANRTHQRKIEVELQSNDHFGLVVIRDNAGGIPEDVIDKVFDPHFTTKSGGTGIGLYMSKTIIEKHIGGSITCQNVADGAEFSVSIPLVASDEAVPE